MAEQSPDLDEMVWMEHDGCEPAFVTRAAFEGAWKPNGWKLMSKTAAAEQDKQGK